MNFYAMCIQIVCSTDESRALSAYEILSFSSAASSRPIRQFLLRSHIVWLSRSK